MKLVGLLVVAAFVVGVGGWVATQLIGNASANARLEVVESTLSPNSDWVKVEESRHPASLTCFGMDNPCPSSTHVYEVSTVTAESLAAVAPKAGLVVTGDCRPKENVAGESSLCTGKGSQDGFTVVASAVTLSGDRTRVAVTITP